METKNRISLIAIGGLLVILAILFSRIVFAKANLQDIQGFQTIQRPTATPMSWALLEIQRLEHNLQYGKIDDYTRQNLRAILTETWLEATQEVEFRITTPQKHPPFTDIPIPTSEYIYLGITTPIPSFPNPNYIINNMWQGLDNGVWVLILAGCLKSDPEQSIIYYQVISGITEIRTEKKSGCLKITEEADNGKKLVLQAKNGDTYYFDIPGRTFVQSLDVVAPTITPRPTEVIPPTAMPVTPNPYPFTKDQYYSYPNPQ